MAVVKIERATIHSAQDFWGRLRDADCREIFSMALMSPRQAVETAIARSERSWVGFIDYQPAAIFGVASVSLVSGVGQTWMLSTDVVEKYPMAFLKSCRYVVDDMRCGYQRIEGWVDARYSMAVKWIKWMGFEVDEAKPLMPLGTPFHKYHMEGRP